MECGRHMHAEEVLQPVGSSGGNRPLVTSSITELVSIRRRKVVEDSGTARAYSKMIRRSFLSRTKMGTEMIYRKDTPSA